MKAGLLSVALILLGLNQIYSQTASSQASPSALPSPSPSPSASPKAAGIVKNADASMTAPSPDKPGSVKYGKSLTLPPEKAQPVKMPHFEKAPVIDGKLDDQIWKNAVVLKDFYQVQPGDNIAPSNPTEVLLGYDEKFIYIAFHCYDDPGKVRANIAKRDNIWDDDYVGILFDTFNDKRRAYEFDFNPLGVQADGIWTDGVNEDFSLDIVMESKGTVTNDGYTIEVAIPFKSLRYVAGKDKLWGAHFWRRTKRLNNELDMWMPLSRDISSWLSQEGHLAGLEGISTERTLELIPSLTVSETGKRKGTLTTAQINAKMLDPGHFVNEPVKLDPGLTGKYTITPTITLDFALNPDFAQVESDQLVIRANQRFPIFFPEKRPFFLEGIDIFQTQISAVHTRAIVDPDFAVKLSGKLNRNTFGLLVASDNNPGNPDNFTDAERTDPANQRLLRKNSSVGILRLKRDIGQSDSFVGLLGTSYNFVDHSNQLGGFDGRFRINKLTTFSWQVLGTTSREDFFFPDGGQTLNRKENGFAYAFDYNNNGRHFGYELSGVGRTRYFRSDVGFNRRVNTNNSNTFIRYNSEPKPKAKLISWRVYTDFSTNFDWQGRSQIFLDESQLRFQLPRQSFFAVAFVKGYERVFEEEFGPKRQSSTCAIQNNCTFAGNDNERSTSKKSFYFYAGSTPIKKFNFFFLADRRWGEFDFDFGAGPKYPRVSSVAVAAHNANAAGLCSVAVPPPVCNAPQDPGAGDFWHVEGNAAYQPTTALRFTLDFTKERLIRYDTRLLAFDENIVSLRSTYQFTRFTFVRARIDYDSLASNVKAQFLFGWTPNPGTAFYVGYNDDINRNGFNAFSGQLEPGFRRNGRTLFVKMSYLFRRSFEGSGARK